MASPAGSRRHVFSGPTRILTPVIRHPSRMQCPILLAAIAQGRLFDALAAWGKARGYDVRHVAADAPDLLALSFDLAIVDLGYYRKRDAEYREYIAGLAAQDPRTEGLPSWEQDAVREATVAEIRSAGRVIRIETRGRWN